MKPAAKKPTKKAAQTGALAKRSVAFVGKFGYSNMNLDRFMQLAASAGAAVVDASKKTPDVLVFGDGRGGKPPSDVARIQKKSPGVHILDQAAFLQRALPTPEMVLAEMHKGRRKDHDRYWENLEWLCRQAGTQIDLSKADLRQANLYGFELEEIVLNGSDLRGANTEYTQFSDLEKVNFDGCIGKNVYLRNLKTCSFRQSNLKETWMFYGDSDKIEKCDFSEATMNGARLEDGTVTDCKFIGANLCDADFEKSVFERADFSKADLSRVHAPAAKFTNCKFARANLNRADLRGVSLAGADLRGANLREAVLKDADLTNADVTGADFQDALLSGAKLKGVDLAKAKNFRPPQVRVAGPRLLELAAAAKGSQSFTTSAEVDLGKNEFATLSLNSGGRGIGARSDYHRAESDDVFDRIPAPTLDQGMINLADRWPHGKLRLDSITVKGSKILRGQKLKDLAIAAWAETFGAAAASPEELKAQRDSHEAEALRERDELMKKIRRQGAKVWNDLDYRLRDRYNLCGADLSGAKLDKIQLWSHELKGASFAGATLVEGELWSGQLANAVFTNGNLEKCGLAGADLNKASFQNANLSEADLTGAKLQGADFTGAKLADAKLEKAQFDETTIFPAGFKPPANMAWKGEGPRPGAKKVKAAKAGTLDFDAFLKRLNAKVEAARMKKAGSMLKAERFQLFADVKDDSLVGIVKSQTDKDLVYSCRLAADGAFGCCTQNLRPCGGLHGALCKHLLVLIVGLAKAGQLDAATVDHWINLSRNQKPALDEETMSATFLRYKGAEAGEVDWRPTETIPEDFYAM